MRNRIAIVLTVAAAAAAFWILPSFGQGPLQGPDAGKNPGQEQGKGKGKVAGRMPFDV